MLGRTVTGLVCEWLRHFVANATFHCTPLNKVLYIMNLHLEAKLSKQDESFLRDRLDEFNEPYAGQRNSEEFGFTVRDDSGTVVAGVVASCIWQ